MSIEETIKNLFNKTTENGCTEAEAASAAAKANELLLKYNLELERIIGLSDSEIEKEMNVSFSQGRLEWDKYLTICVAKHNLCAILRKTFSGAVLTDYCQDACVGIYIFGRATNVRATEMMLDWIREQMFLIFAEEKKKYVKLPSKYKNSFMYGMGRRIDERLKESRETFEIEDESKAMVLRVDKEARDFMKTLMEVKKGSAGKTWINQEGFSRGMKAGDNVSFAPQKSMNEGQKRIG